MRKRKQILITSLVLLASFLLSSIVVFGADRPRNLSWYINNASILSRNTVASNVGRYIVWAITKIVAYITSICAGLFDKTFGLIDITTNPAISNEVEKFKGVLVALTVLCITALGIIIMVKKEKRPILRNILMAMIAVSLSLYSFTTLNTLARDFKDGVLNGETTSSIYETIDNNMIDLVKLDSRANINSVNYRSGAGISTGAGISNKDDVNNIDYLEVLDYHNKDEGQNLYGWSDNFNKLISYSAIRTPKGLIAQEVYAGFMGSGIGNNFYYRYSFDFFPCILELFSIMVVYLALSYKNVRIAYELVVSRLMAYVFASDIGNGERLKNILFFIRDTYITLCISVFCIKLFTVITGLLSTIGINGLSKSIIILFIAFAVIDGPNLVERVIGMDAGLSSSFAKTLAIVGMAKMATRSAKNIGSGIAKGAMATATGKTKAQRSHENGYASPMEKIGLAMNRNAGARGSNSNNYSKVMGEKKKGASNKDGYMGEYQDKSNVNSSSSKSSDNIDKNTAVRRGQSNNSNLGYNSDSIMNSEAGRLGSTKADSKISKGATNLKAGTATAVGAGADRKASQNVRANNTGAYNTDFMNSSSVNQGSRVLGGAVTAGAIASNVTAGSSYTNGSNSYDDTTSIMNQGAGNTFAYGSESMIRRPRPITNSHKISRAGLSNIRVANNYSTPRVNSVSVKSLVSSMGAEAQEASSPIVTTRTIESRGASSSYGASDNVTTVVENVKTGRSIRRNPQLRQIIQELAPSKEASQGERRDFHRQIDNIIRGTHEAIKPDENSRAEYKMINYEKAKKIAKAYHSKEEKDGR